MCYQAGVRLEKGEHPMTTNNDLGAVHPVADLFPLLAGDELQQLAEDIRRNGLHQPNRRRCAHGAIDRTFRVGVSTLDAPSFHGPPASHPT